MSGEPSFEDNDMPKEAAPPESPETPEKEQEETREATPLGKIYRAFDPERTSEEEVSKLEEHIRQSSPEEFSYFLTQEFATNLNRHFLPDSVIEAVMERRYQLYETIEPEKRDEWMMSDLERAIQLHGDFKRQKESDESVTDKAFRAFVRLYPKHPEASDKLWEFLGQNGQTIRPDIFIEGLADMLWRPATSLRFRQDALAALNYLHAFSGDRYDKAILKNLNFENPENFYRTGVFLDFLKSFHVESGNWSFSDERRGPERVQKLLTFYNSLNAGFVR